MTAQGGRDTEPDLFGQPGGYVSRCSKNTAGQPCGRCGDRIVKESYMGGSIYYCPTCQTMNYWDPYHESSPIWLLGQMGEEAKEGGVEGLACTRGEAEGRTHDTSQIL
jgi:endogenous inhibitor of DNA gyrase (YacG/DUF329 family)